MSKRAAEWLLAGVIFARSTSLLFARVGLESMSPLNLLAVRFCLAFVVLCVIFWRKLRTVTKTDLLHGMILGGVFFTVMTCEVFALTMTTASNVSFLVNTAIVIVPLFEAVLHRKAPDHRTLLCAAVTLVGVGCLTLKNGLSGFGLGEGLCLLEACLYAGGHHPDGPVLPPGGHHPAGHVPDRLSGGIRRHRLAAGGDAPPAPERYGVGRDPGAGAGVLLLRLYLPAGGPAIHHR